MEHTVLSPTEQLFDSFLYSDLTLDETLNQWQIIKNELQLNDLPHNLIFRKLKESFTSWRVTSFLDILQHRANVKEYANLVKACDDCNIFVVGAGPCGLRFAIEAALCGSRIVVVEKRRSFTRNNVLHLWPYLIPDLRNLGIKKLYGKFCAGSLDHIKTKKRVEGAVPEQEDEKMLLGEELPLLLSSESSSSSAGDTDAETSTEEEEKPLFRPTPEATTVPDSKPSTATRTIATSTERGTWVPRDSRGEGNERNTQTTCVHGRLELHWNNTQCGTEKPFEAERPPSPYYKASPLGRLRDEVNYVAIKYLISQEEEKEIAKRLQSIMREWAHKVGEQGKMAKFREEWAAEIRTLQRWAGQMAADNAWNTRDNEKIKNVKRLGFVAGKELVKMGIKIRFKGVLIEIETAERLESKKMAALSWWPANARRELV